MFPCKEHTDSALLRYLGFSSQEAHENIYYYHSLYLSDDETEFRKEEVLFVGPTGS
jgi:hypothetical protein